MNKSAVKNFAVWARNELIKGVENRAFLLGVSENDLDESLDTFKGVAFSQEEASARKALIKDIKNHGYRQTIEEVAYTWFNRLCALRFMEVNDFLPNYIRPFAAFPNPEILRNSLNQPIDGLDKQRLTALQSKKEDLYRYMLLAICNSMNKSLPNMFECIQEYTTFLLPNGLLTENSIIAKLVHAIPDDGQKDAVQIIGWLYQHYNTESKNLVFAGLKENKKIDKDNIPVATQLFTPDWIVRYMVENSLGKLWLDKGKADWSSLKDSWKYYIEPAEQAPEVQAELDKINDGLKAVKITDIKFIDPCMGSGHILVYAFDVFMQIYESQGYDKREAAKLILQNNLYGLDVDKRAYQLSYFALMMKGRQYNRRIFEENLELQLYHPEGYADGEEFGSLIKADKASEKPAELTTLYDAETAEYNFTRLLAQKYDVVCTNPPYMGKKSLNSTMSEYLRKHYPKGKTDLYTAFILRCQELTKQNGYTAMITIHTWMFISSYADLRKELISNSMFTSMVHCGAGTFEELNSFNVLSTAFVTNKSSVKNYMATYIRLASYYNTPDKLNNYNNLNNRYIVNKEEFEIIPNNPIVYWISCVARNAFNIAKQVREYAEPKQGLATGDNEKFVRYWFEVSNEDCAYLLPDKEAMFESGKKYAPYNKGGNFRKWFGMNEYVIKFDKLNYELLSQSGNHLPSRRYYFKKGLTWSLFGFENFGVRYKEEGFVFDVSGSSMFPSEDNMKYILGFLASNTAFYYLSILAPTVNFQVGNIGDLPLLTDENKKPQIDKLVEDNIALSRADWDSFEASQDFKKHPLL